MIASMSRSAPSTSRLQPPNPALSLHSPGGGILLNRHRPPCLAAAQDQQQPPIHSSVPPSSDAAESHAPTFTTTSSLPSTSAVPFGTPPRRHAEIANEDGDGATVDAADQDPLTAPTMTRPTSIMMTTTTIGVAKTDPQPAPPPSDVDADLSRGRTDAGDRATASGSVTTSRSASQTVKIRFAPLPDPSRYDDDSSSFDDSEISDEYEIVHINDTNAPSSGALLSASAPNDAAGRAWAEGQEIVLADAEGKTLRGTLGGMVKRPARSRKEAGAAGARIGDEIEERIVQLDGSPWAAAVAPAGEDGGVRHPAAKDRPGGGQSSASAATKSAGWGKRLLRPLRIVGSSGGGAFSSDALSLSRSHSRDEGNGGGATADRRDASAPTTTLVRGQLARRSSTGQLMGANPHRSQAEKERMKSMHGRRISLFGGVGGGGGDGGSESHFPRIDSLPEKSSSRRRSSCDKDKDKDGGRGRRLFGFSSGSVTSVTADNDLSLSRTRSGGTSGSTSTVTGGGGGGGGGERRRKRSRSREGQTPRERVPLGSVGSRNRQLRELRPGASSRPWSSSSLLSSNPSVAGPGPVGALNKPTTVVDEPKFDEWGPLASPSSRPINLTATPAVGSSSADKTAVTVKAGSSGEGGDAEDDEDDGSGMAWVRRRRKQREEKERREKEAKEAAAAAAAAMKGGASADDADDNSTKPTPARAAGDEMGNSDEQVTASFSSSSSSTPSSSSSSQTSCDEEGRRDDEPAVRSDEEEDEEEEEEVLQKEEEEAEKARRTTKAAGAEVVHVHKRE